VKNFEATKRASSRWQQILYKKISTLRRRQNQSNEKMTNDQGNHPSSHTYGEIQTTKNHRKASVIWAFGFISSFVSSFRPAKMCGQMKLRKRASQLLVLYA
jgi:hypothetical protein